MTYQADPFDAMRSSFNALQGAWDQGTRNKAGRAYASGDMEGATNALAGGGMIPEAQAMRGQMRAEEDRTRGTQITAALRDNPSAAAGLAQTPEELAGVQEFIANATREQREAAAAGYGRIAAVAEAVKNLPPDQQRAAAVQYAEQFGMDPSQIPEQITPEWIEGIRVQALGLEEYLKHQREEEKLKRPMFSPFGMYMPPGTQPPSGGQPEYVDQLPPNVRPRPNQPPSAPAAGGGERSQTPRVSFRSSQDARQSVSQMVPGVRVTNADRTPADTARLRRQGYKPSDTSFHLQGQALDLVPPSGMSMAELEAKMRQAGFRVLNEGHHIHVSW